MDDERAVEEIVTKFLLNTCRLRPELTIPAVDALANNAAAATTPPPNDAEAHWIPLTTGSVAEFYIEPMLPYIGDIDVMYHRSTLLAIPEGQSPPTQLPAEFHNYVEVFEIIDSHLPGYVYLELRYLLTECDDDGKYNAEEYDRLCYLSNRYFDADRNDLHHTVEIHGPAQMIRQRGTLLSRDVVRCVRCLSWPPQAADWPTRHRNYGWPDSATVDHVVNNGCDLVGVAHHQCRQHEWMGEHQHRLSFSRAEIVLLNSWMPVQQIVYHMLRFFMNAVRLTDSADNSATGKLSNYHIKTLMLWACEKKPRIWWTDDLSLIRTCTELLHVLAVWLTEERCAHYFINNCNLAVAASHYQMIASRLLPVSKSSITSWIVNNYIQKCSQLCPHKFSRLYDDVRQPVKLYNAVSAIADWRLNTTLRDWFDGCYYAQYLIALHVYKFSLTVRSFDLWFSQLAKISTSLGLSEYFIAVTFLHIAGKISTTVTGISEELMDVLAKAVGEFTGPRRYSSQHSSWLSLSKAAKLMKVVACNSRSTLQLIEIELSKAYLYRALRYEDCNSNSIYCLANVYLAVLHYTTGQYQTAIDHCALVTRSQDHSQCSSHVVQGELLPKIDDDIDVVLGLAVFYQHVRTAALNQQGTQHVTVFTTELFAHYLYMKCLSVTKFQQLSDTAQSQSSSSQFQGHVEHILSDIQQRYVADMLLWKLVNHISAEKYLRKQQFHGCDYWRNCQTELYTPELNVSKLTKLLQQSAVERLTTFRQLEAQDYGSVVSIVTTDFEAMYAYKRGDYQRCLQLSTQNVHTLLYAVRMADVLTFPEFIHLLDDDIVSLIALTLIVNPACRKDMHKYTISQLTLSLYLMTQCQLKLSHSLTSLTQTLHHTKVAQKRHYVNEILSHLTLKLTVRTLLRHLNNE